MYYFSKIKDFLKMEKILLSNSEVKHLKILHKGELSALLVDNFQIIEN
jgi:hypothetical protein